MFELPFIDVIVRGEWGVLSGASNEREVGDQVSEFEALLLQSFFEYDLF